ncbi:unnamed protein product [Brassica oleracea]
MSSPSPQVESSPSPAKRNKKQSDEQFKITMEENDKLIKAITKSTSERNKIQRKKVEVQRMKQEYKILFSDLNSITDRVALAYIENEREIILRRRASTCQHEEHGQGSQSQHHGSQYQASQIQGEHI